MGSIERTLPFELPPYLRQLFGADHNRQRKQPAGELVYALLARDIGTSAARWRQENGINLTEHKILSFPHYTPFGGSPLQGKVASEQDIRKAIEALLGGGSGELTTQLNRSYVEAKEIYGVNVKVRPEGFSFVLNYGFDGSSWTHELAATPNMWEGQGDTFRYNPYGQNSEPFINTLDRAITALKGLTHATAR